MAVRATQGGYTLRIDANASGFAFSGLQRIPTTDEAKYIVWVSGSLYQTFNTARGIVEYSGTSAFDAIKTAQSGAFTQGYGFTDVPFSGDSEIIIKEGGYFLGSDFTGFDIHEKTNIRLARSAHLFVPTSYSGYVFKIPGRIDSVHIKGGMIVESGTAENLNNSGRLWTAFHLFASGEINGVYYNKIEDIDIWNPKYGFHLQTSTNGWINSNTIQDCQVQNAEVGLKLTAASGAVASNGVNSNNFINISVQAISGTSRGGVDAESGRGNRNTWLDCTMWDFAVTSGAYSAHFGDHMMNQIIIGGAMTYLDYHANGSGVLTFDAYTSPRFDSNVTINGALYADMIEASGAGSILTMRNLGSGQGFTAYLYGISGTNATSYSLWNSTAFSERMLVFKGTEHIIRSTKNTADGVVRPITLGVQDTAIPTLIEGMRVDISGNVEFNRSGGVPRFDSISTSGAAVSGMFFSGKNPVGFLSAQISGGTAIRIPYFNA